MRPKSNKSLDESAAIAHRLNKARKDKKLTYRELGERLGMSVSQIGNIMTGSHILSDRTLVLICNELGVPPKRIDPSYIQPKLIIGPVMTVPE